MIGNRYLTYQWEKNPTVAEAIKECGEEMLHDQRIAEKPEFVVAPLDFLLIIVLGFLRYISSWACILDHLYVGKVVIETAEVNVEPAHLLIIG